MARSHFRYTVTDRAGNAIQNSTVTLYLTGTSTLVTDLYTTAVGGSPVASASLVSNAQGEVEGWLSTPKTVDVQVADTSHSAYYSGAVGTLLTWSPFIETVEVTPPPENVGLLDGTQGWTGINTFGTNPVFNDAAIPEAKVANLVSDLAAITALSVRAICDTDFPYQSLSGLARLQAAATDAAARGAELWVLNNYTISTWVLPASIPRLVVEGTLTQAALNSNLLDVSACAGMRLLSRNLIGAGTTAAASNNSAIVGRGDGSNYGSGPNGLIIERGTKISGFASSPIDIYGADRFVVEDGVEIAACIDGVRLTGCRDFTIGRFVKHDDALVVSSTILQTGLYLNSTDQNGYGVCDGGELRDPTVRNVPGCEAFLFHAGRNISGKVSAQGVAECGGFAPYNASDVCDNNHVEADITLISPQNVTAAAWSSAGGGQGVITLGTSQSIVSGDVAFVAGQSVTLAGFTPSAWNGNWVIAAVTGGGIGVGATLTLTMVSNPGAATVMGTVVYATNAPTPGVCWQVGGGSGLTEAAQTVTADGGWSAGFITLTMASAATFPVGINGVVTLAGFTPSALNGTWQYRNRTGTTIQVAIPSNPGAVTIEGTAAYVNPPLVTSSSSGGTRRNGNWSKHAGWGADHVGYVKGFVQSDTQYVNCWGAGLVVTQAALDLNVGRGDVMRSMLPLGGVGAGILVSAAAAGATGRIGGIDVDTAVNAIEADGSCPGLFFEEAVAQNLSGSLYNGESNLTKLNPTPWLIDVDVFATAIAQTNWNTITHVASTAYGGYKISTGAQNASISFDVVLGAGTWTLEFMYTQNTDAGIYTVVLDGATLGTVDGGGALSADLRQSWAGNVIASTRKARVTLTMATKGAGSSYFGYLQHLQLRRTA